MSSGEEHWIAQQERAFSAWVNSVLVQRSLQLETGKRLAEQFNDGLLLIPLVEILTGGKCKKHVAKPKSRIQMSENVTLAFEVLEAQEPPFHPDAHVEEILDASEDADGGAAAASGSKMVFGLLYQLFLRFGTNDDSNAAELLAWVQARVNDNDRYDGVNVTNFSGSFQDGKAFAALLDSLSPAAVLDYTTVDTAAPVSALNSAFDAANSALGVPKLLDAEETAAFAPDDKAVKMWVTMVKAAWAEKEDEILAAERAEAERRANMTKEDALAELDAALAKLAKLKNCPECNCDLAAWLEAQEADA